MSKIGKKDRLLVSGVYRDAVFFHLPEEGVKRIEERMQWVMGLM